ncbi:MAG: chemotaxis protein CheW [Cyanobacteria bacterium P01_H01_bin.153]
MNSTSTFSQQSGLAVRPQGGAIAPKKLSQYTYSHLKFQLGNFAALLPTHQILEAITLSAASLTPMPNMPPAMLGLINRRSQVLWVADLALLLGIPVIYPNSQQYSLVLLQLNQVLIGLRVHEISNIMNLLPEEICVPPAHIPAGIVPFLRGCYLQDREVLLVLNGESILHAPALQST